MAGRPCLTCVHPDRRAIDLALATGAASKAAISRKYGIPPDSVQYHSGKHVPHLVQVGQSGRQVAATLDFKAELQTLLDQANERLEKASDSNWAGIAKVKAMVLDSAFKMNETLTPTDTKVTVTISMDPDKAADA